MIGIFKKHFNKQVGRFVWVFRFMGFLLAVYGVLAFIKRDIGNYMFLRHHFVFFDFEEPLISFLSDYIAIMALFVFVGHYFTEFLRWYVRVNGKSKSRNIGS